MEKIDSALEEQSPAAAGRTTTGKVLFNAYIQFDPETRLYFGVVPGITGAYTQAATLDELRENLKEVLELCMEENADEISDLPQFIGLQQIELSI